MQGPVHNESVEFEVKPRAPRVRGRTIALAVTGLVVIALIAVVVGVVVNRSATPQADPLAKVMPADTMGYISFNTRPDRLPYYDVAAKAWADVPEAEQIEDGLKAAIQFAGFDWEDDIQSWLGDRVAIGLVDLGGYEAPTPALPGDTSPYSYPRYRSPEMVVAAQVTDRAQLDQFLAAYRASRESQLTGDSAMMDQTYRGIPIVYAALDSEFAPVGEAYAVIDDVVVLSSNGPDGLKKSIDAALDGTGLSASEDFNQTMDALPEANVFAFYVDYGRYMQAVVDMQAGMFGGFGDDSARNRMQEQLQRQMELMQTMGGMGGTMSYEPTGLRFDGAIRAHPEFLPESMRALYNSAPPASGRMYDSIPSSAALAIDSSFPPGFWTATLDNPDWLQMAAGGYGMSGPAAQKLAEFEGQAGVDLGADLLDLLSGEMAIVLLPAPEAAQALPADPFSFSYYGRFPFEFAVLFDSSDAARAAASLDKVLNALIARLGGEVSVQALDSLPGSALVDPAGNVVLAYGVVDGRLVIGSNPDTLRAIDTADQAPLSADATFQAAMSVLNPNRLSSGYLEPNALIEGLFQFLLGGYRYGSDSAECQPCRFFAPMEWVSFDSEPPDDATGVQRGSMHICLQP